MFMSFSICFSLSTLQFAGGVPGGGCRVAEHAGDWLSDGKKMRREMKTWTVLYDFFFDENEMHLHHVSAI